jgi:hypothetical protein
MNGQSKLTPRTKGGQVAPEDAPPLVSSADTDPGAGETRIVPADALPSDADNKDVVKRVERMVRYAGHKAFKENIRLFGKMMVPVVIVSAWMFGMFAALSYAVPHWICEKEAMELSVGFLMVDLWTCVLTVLLQSHKKRSFAAGLLPRPRLLCARR